MSLWNSESCHSVRVLPHCTTFFLRLFFATFYSIRDTFYHASAMSITFINIHVASYFLSPTFLSHFTTSMPHSTTSVHFFLSYSTTFTFLLCLLHSSTFMSHPTSSLLLLCHILQHLCNFSVLFYNIHATFNHIFATFLSYSTTFTQHSRFCYVC